MTARAFSRLFREYMIIDNKFPVPVLCLFAGVVLLPFSDSPYFRDLFREIGSYAAFFPVSAGIFFALIGCRPGCLAAFPKTLPTAALAAFLVWVVFSGVMNYDSILEAFSKGRHGWQRYASQLLVLVYGILVSLYVFTLRKSPDFPQYLRKAILVSFLAPAAYSLFEILYIYGILSESALFPLAGLLHSSVNIYPRIHALSPEPSQFALYAAFLFPWLISAFMTAKSKRRIFYAGVIAYFCFLVILTFSRAAYYVVLGELGVLTLALLYFGESKRKIFSLLLLMASSVTLANFLSPEVRIYNDAAIRRPFFKILLSITFREDAIFSTSVNARLGAQAANLYLGMDKPFFGVGLGQSGFYMGRYIPKWVVLTPEVKNWTDPSPASSWPPAHGLYARIIAETGFPGLLLWCSMWGALLREVFKRMKEKGIVSPDYAGVSLLTAIAGIAVMGVNLDSFKFFEYWILMGCAWIYIAPRAEAR